MHTTSNQDAFLTRWKQTASGVQSSSEEDQEASSAAEMNDTSFDAPAPKRNRWWKRRGLWMGLGVVVLILLVVGGVSAAVGFTVYQTALEVKAEAMSAANEGRGVYESFKTQNLPQAKEQLSKVQMHIQNAQRITQRLSWTKNLPIAGKYYEDSEHGFTAALSGIDAGFKVIAAVEPHADLLGFKGKGTFAGSTEDRIGIVLDTLNTISPALDSIGNDIEKVQSELSQIDPNDYPETVQGYPVREYLVKGRAAADAAALALSEARPALERIPEVAGSETRRKYLVIFQNDNELRPTGGFMTAYAVVFVENGKVSAEKSDDIYELDKKFRNKPAIPPELGRFLITEKSWNLRDMNIDPSFKNSMQNFYSYYQKLPGEPQNIDGIIAIDTNILERIVEILGPVEVPGYGTFSSQKVERCDCPQIIYALSEIIDRPTPYHRENRKGILAPMMQGIIQKTYATDRQKWPQLAQLLWEGIQGRHVQMYFFNPEDQKAAESVDAAGIMPVIPEGSDYLTVIDANLGGAKSNLFVETTGVQKVLGIQNGRVRKEVELTYRNTHAPSNCNLEAGELCLNGILNNWTRWYVPKGAQIETVIGLDEGYKLDTNYAGYDIIDGVFKLSPKSQAKVRITYSVPYTTSGEYRLEMQKQGGIAGIPFTIETPWGEKEVLLDRDQSVVIKQ